MLKRNIFSFIIAFVILFLSFSESETFDSVTSLEIPFASEFVHIGMYFSLMAAISYENKDILLKMKQLFLTGIIPFAYGFLIEVLQPLITKTRTFEIKDLLCNLTGILFAVLVWQKFMDFRKKRVK
jgi:VanZ family protein